MPFTILVFLFFGSFVNSQGSSGQPGQNSGGAVSGNVIGCEISLLRSYLLKGRASSTDSEPFLLCPNVVNNCCLKADQQRIFHTVKEILPARINEYTSKIKMAMARLKNFHKKIGENIVPILGNNERRNFCMKEARNVMNFPFNGLYESILEELDQLDDEMKTYYQSFYCILCDAENHPNFELKGSKPKIVFSFDFCKQFLVPKQSLLQKLNVELINYLSSLQNYVDCVHYVRSYNLRFFDDQKVALKKDTTTCLNFINTSKFEQNCKPICEKLTVSKIIVLVQGDFEFLMDAANLFEKFYDFKETGNFVSAKLRNFFKKFVVTSDMAKAVNKNRKGRKLTNEKKDKEQKTEKIEKKEEKENENLKKLKKSKRILKKNLKNKETKKTKAISKKKEVKKMEKQKQTKTKPENLGKTSAKKLKKTKLKKNKRSKKSRKLSHSNSSIIDIIPKSIEEESLPVSSDHEEGEVLKIERILDDNAPQKNLAKTFVNSDLATFYSLIEIVLNKDRKNMDTIYQIDTNPIDFELPLKSWSSGGGINPMKYASNSFNMTSTQFYRKLYIVPTKEKQDVNIEFLLSDFNDDNWEETHNVLKDDYKISSKNYLINLNLTATDEGNTQQIKL